MKSEEALLHRAIFGDVKGAHNLIVASPSAPELVLGDLASRYTDRCLPAELSYEPYSCGFPVGDCYVVTRTFPVKATRGGMVETHALIGSLSMIGETPLASLLALLPTEPMSTRPTLIAPVSGTLNASEASQVSVIPRGYSSLVRHLMGANVPIWVGQDGFEEAIIFLWERLWPEARKNFRFRISAEPNDLADFPATIICTPTALRGNWNEQCFIDRTTTTLPNPSLCEAYLLSLPAAAELGTLRARIGFSPKSVKDLKRLEQYDQMLRGDTADSLLAGVRLLNAISPQPQHNGEEKQRLLSRLQDRTAHGTADDLLGLRNLDLSGFDHSLELTKDTVAQWFRLRPTVDGESVRVVKEIFLGAGVWTARARVGVSQVFANWSRHSANLLWGWWSTEPPLVNATDELIPANISRQAEADLLDTMPSSMSDQLRKAVLSLSKTRLWGVLHGAMLATAPDLTTAAKLRSQIEIQPDKDADNGLTQLANQLPEQEVLNAAVEIQDVRLLSIAGQITLRLPALMATLNVSSHPWRVIWLYHVQNGGLIFDGIASPATTAHLFFDAIVNGTINVDDDLIGHVVGRQESELFRYERRPQLWNYLQGDLFVLENALDLCAQGWLRQFVQDPKADPKPLEPFLKAKVLQRWQHAPEMATAAGMLLFWDRFGGDLSEDDFRGWLDRNTVQLSTLESVAVGQLIARNRWIKAAKALNHIVQYRGRRDLSAAIHECAGMLDFWDRCSVSFFTAKPNVTADEWWQAWLDLSQHLYPRGVDQGDIWQHADGDLSRIREGSGREQWRHGLDLLQKGGAGGSMTIEGLLHQMRKQFWSNSQLALLERIYLERLRGS